MQTIRTERCSSDVYRQSRKKAAIFDSIKMDGRADGIQKKGFRYVMIGWYVVVRMSIVYEKYTDFISVSWGHRFLYVSWANEGWIQPDITSTHRPACTSVCLYGA